MIESKIIANKFINYLENQDTIFALIDIGLDKNEMLISIIQKPHTKSEIIALVGNMDSHALTYKIVDVSDLKIRNVDGFEKALDRGVLP